MALILDTGPLYAALDRDDADHAACRQLLESASEPLIVPSPVLVEVEYWTHRRLGAGAWLALLDDIDSGAFLVEDLVAADYRRVRGSVIHWRLAEPKLATLDRRHFGTLRPRHVDALVLLPIDEA